MTTVINNVAPAKVRKYRYSEIFGNTFQGEGQYTGRPTVWIRFWGCNFECAGFGQDNPDDPSTYVLDYENLNVDDYKSMEELPVFHRGCDSSYSWARKFSHLAHHESVEEIVDRIEALLPGGKFKHPKSGQWHHIAFTGGEPLMNQNAIADIMAEFARRDNSPRFVTIETNGTQALRSQFSNAILDWFNKDSNNELFWSVSPKLYLSGENRESALNPDVVQAYFDLSNAGQLKYVCNGTERNWQEVEEFTEEYRAVGIDWDVWIMPVGADREMQESHQAVISEAAVERGYSVAARVHTWVFGNVIGK